MRFVFSGLHHTSPTIFVYYTDKYHLQTLYYDYLRFAIIL